MKSMGSKGFLMAVIVIVALNACISSQPMTPEPTSTAAPTPAPVLAGSYELLSPEDMRADLDELFRQIEANHPDPYRNRPKAEVDLDRQHLSEELGKPMTTIDFYKKVAPLVGSLDDEHTRVTLSDEVWEEIDAKERFLPVVIEFRAERAFITENYTGNPDVPLGAELLAINGEPLADIQSGFVHVADMPFDLQLWLLKGSVPEYKLDVLPAGKTTPASLILPGLTFEEMVQTTAAKEAWEPLTYNKLPDEKIGILTINRFIEMMDLLQPTFAQIQTDQLQHLVIDVRANGGGYYESVARLMQYLTDQPYRTCSRKYKAPLGGYGSGTPRETKCVNTRPYDAPERFQGKLYLLIGPETRSAAITLAAILQDFDLATLIGEETTDPASYCADVAVGGIMLPRTKLKYMYPRTCFVRPSGILDNHGVIPDIIVETTMEDLAAGNDPVMNYTLELIRNGERTP